MWEISIDSIKCLYNQKNQIPSPEGPFSQPLPQMLLERQPLLVRPLQLVIEKIA